MGMEKSTITFNIIFFKWNNIASEDSGILNAVTYSECERDFYLVIHTQTSRFLDYIHQHIIYWASRKCQKDLENKITYWALYFGANEWLQWQQSVNIDINLKAVGGVWRVGSVVKSTCWSSKELELGTNNP